MKTFNELKNQLCASSTAKTVAVVWPADEDTLQSMALTLIRPTMPRAKP